jgi:lipoprotein-anchoring transpeptidase ErfK/SrfK
MRYGVGVGKEGFAWSGTAVVHDKQARARRPFA